jgi:hypothetical protein
VGNNPRIRPTCSTMQRPHTSLSRLSDTTATYKAMMKHQYKDHREAILKNNPSKFNDI